MKLAFVCSNYGSIQDGIGHYCSKIVEKVKEIYPAFTVEVFTGNTVGHGKTSLVISLAMTAALFRTALSVISRHTNCVIVEYPFYEWNPMVLLAIWFNKVALWLCNGKLIISLHEYKRANFLRQCMIRHILSISDIIFATEPQDIVDLIHKKIVYQRYIPSNIEPMVGSSKHSSKPNSFCYFGLISKSKAFDEMLEGWKKFNAKGIYELHVCTSSDYGYRIEDMIQYNVSMHLSCNERAVSEILSMCDFGILPIRPFVSTSNATLKALLLHGCIPIGKIDPVCDEFANLFITIESYHPDAFARAIDKAVSLPLQAKEALRTQGTAYARKFTIEKTCREIVGNISEVYYENSASK
jgi:glycosyltransferase involved in cell wall biosynthesis